MESKKHNFKTLNIKSTWNLHLSLAKFVTLRQQNSFWACDPPASQMKQKFHKCCNKNKSYLEDFEGKIWIGNFHNSISDIGSGEGCCQLTAQISAQNRLFTTKPAKNPLKTDFLQQNLWNICSKQTFHNKAGEISAQNWLFTTKTAKYLLKTDFSQQSRRNIRPKSPALLCSVPICIVSVNHSNIWW